MTDTENVFDGFALLGDDEEFDVDKIFGSSSDEPAPPPPAPTLAEEVKPQPEPEQPLPAKTQEVPAEEKQPLELFSAFTSAESDPIPEAAPVKSIAPRPQTQLSLFDKPPVFQYGGAREQITDADMTFEALRIQKADDFPELEDASAVTWQVRYEEIAYAVETIRAAHLFYEYGKLDRLLEIGVTHSEDDLFEIYYDLLAAATDYMDEKFNDDYEVNHWYFSFRSMMQYYRLIREYGSLHSMRLSENPYVKKAEQKLAAELYSCGCSGGMGWGYQMKISSKWSSGVMVETDCYFHGEYELLEALLAIDAWYTEEVRKLETLLKVERAAKTAYVPELEAA